MKRPGWFETTLLRVWPRVAVLVCLGVYGSVACAQVPWSWLSSGTVSRDNMTSTLNALWSMTPDEAAQAARSLLERVDGASGEKRQAAHLLQAVALERATSVGSAKAAYEQIAGDVQPSAYSATAKMRSTGS